MQFLHELAEKAVHMKNIRFNMKRAYKIRRDLTEQVEVGEGVTLTFKRGEAKYLKQIENMVDNYDVLTMKPIDLKKACGLTVYEQYKKDGVRLYVKDLDIMLEIINEKYI